MKELTARDATKKLAQLQDAKKWIVLYLKGGRIASFENTQENKAKLRDAFYLSLEKSFDGHEYYNILAVK